MTDGDWSSHTDYSDPARQVRLWTIRIGEVFNGEVVLEARDGDPKEYWWARVNNDRLGGYPSAEQAKAVVDRQIWTYAEAAREGLKRVKAREHIWRDAFNFPPPK
jgi:hypothetical protein